MVEIPTLKRDGQNWKIHRTRILEVAATLKVLEVLIGLEKDNGSDYWLGRDTKARFLLYPILPPQLLDSILQLNTAHEMFVYLERKFHNSNPIERVAENKVETCANDKVSNGQSGSASLHAAQTYQTVKQAGIAAESPENPPTSGDRQCHDRDIPPQPSHIYSCPLAVQTPPEHSLTKPKPIPGLPNPSIAFPNSSAAFPKGCCTDICLVSIPEAVNTIPEHI